MAYTGGGGDIGSLRFLAANCVYQVTQAMLNGDDASDRGALDDAVMLLDVISSYHTEDDKAFAQEMAEIKTDREEAKGQVKAGHELAPEVLEGFRWRELKAMFRSLCRAGTFVRVESPESSWKPEMKGAK